MDKPKTIEKASCISTTIRLSLNDPTEQLFYVYLQTKNNVILETYLTAADGDTLALIDDTGVLSISHNWFKPGWVHSFFGYSGTIKDDGTSVESSVAGFLDELNQDYHLTSNATCVDSGTSLHSAVIPDHDIENEYVKHQSNEPRPDDGFLDIGTYEYLTGDPSPVQITKLSLPDGTKEGLYSGELQALGGISPYNWVILQGALPIGLNLDSSSGIISGVPTGSGTFTFNIQVEDMQLPPTTDEKALSITIHEPQPEPVVIESASLPNATLGQEYSTLLAGTGGIVPYFLSIVSGQLPPGLSINSATGEISGTASKNGKYRFTAQVRDAQVPPSADQKQLTIRVSRR